MNILIGVSGISGSGRHGAAMYLARHLELRAHAISTPITRCCAATINMDYEIFRNLEKDQPIGALGDRTKRQFLRDVGKFYREQVDLFLLRQLEHRMQSQEASNNLFNGNIVTDIRLDTEAEWVRFNNGKIIHIKNDHVSPTDFDVIDFGVEVLRDDIVIQNNGNVEQLHEKLDSVIKLIRINSGLQVA